jgi:hypothetical protein
MLEKGLLPGFSVAARAELSRLQTPATKDDKQVRDPRNLLGVSMTPVIATQR